MLLRERERERERGERERERDRESKIAGGGTVDYFSQFCAISKVPMVLIKENIH